MYSKSYVCLVEAFYRNLVLFVKFFICFTVPPPGPGFMGGPTTSPYPPPVGGHPAPYPSPMPVPYSGGATPYPPAPYPAGHPAPYPPATGAPYPPGGAPYPPSSGAPYPPAGAPYPAGVSAPPPSYNDAMGQPAPIEPEKYHKQSPYNPQY